MIVDLTPAKAKASIRSLALGKEPCIPTRPLFRYLDRMGRAYGYGFLDKVTPEADRSAARAASRAKRKAAKDDFITFAKRLHALEDPRTDLTEGVR